MPEVIIDPGDRGQDSDSDNCCPGWEIIQPDGPPARLHAKRDSKSPDGWVFYAHTHPEYQPKPQDYSQISTQASEQQTSIDTNLHACQFPDDVPWDDFGVAVGSVRERPDGTLWVDNEEYANQVNYCPVCGYPAKVFI